MSMKFLTGLQDLLGLYNGEGSSTSNTTNGSTSVPIGSNTGHTHYPNAGTSPQRKKSLQEVNSGVDGKDDTTVQRCSHSRSVRFPEKVDELVSGYHEAPTNPFHNKDENNVVSSNEEILSAYRCACVRLGVLPNGTVEKQIGYLHHVPCVRQELLSLKGERVSHPHMEALEEVFRRVQFEQLDFEYTFLDDDSVIALGEMMEFYDSTHKLNLSFNKQITLRGWNAIFKAVRNCYTLQMLNLRYTSLSEKALPSLCRTLRAQPQPTLSCLHLENVNLSGKNLLLVVCALKSNITLKELYLGENSLQPTDGAHLYQLIVSNTGITTLDLRNNELHDGGVRHICDALRNAETCTRSSLQALVLWNNRLTGACMDSLAVALKSNHRLETLNVGSNSLGEQGIANLKAALLQQDGSLHRLGLQSTNMNNQCAIMLAECLADNNAMVRIDLRDNPSVGSAGLLALHSAMKLNKSITLLNLDQRLAMPTTAKVRPYQDEFRRYFDEIRSYCDRNKQAAIQAMSVCTVAIDGEMQTEGEKTPKEENVEKTEEGESARDEETQTEECSQETTMSCECEEEKKVEMREKAEEEEEACCTSSLLTKPKKNPKMNRSASLTCAETIPDITERLREMSGSTHSLDDTAASSNAESQKTIKKGVASPTISPSPALHKVEWGSLPTLPQSSVDSPVPSVLSPLSSTPSPSGKPIVRKLRRFSVSPTSSTFELGGPTLKSGSLSSLCLPGPSSPSIVSRPLSLPFVGIPLGVPCPEANGSQSAPILSSSLPPSFSSSGTFSPVHERTSSLGCCDEEIERICERAENEEIQRRKEEKEKEERLRKEEETQREMDIRVVINDLINYVVYEESCVVERKRSLLLQSSTFNEHPIDTNKLMEALKEEQMETPTTPSRMLSIAEELSNESDEMIVGSVVRNIVRQVLKKEKEELRSTLDRKRTRMREVGSASSSPSPSTPV